MSTRRLHRPQPGRARRHRQLLLLVLAWGMVGCDDSNEPAACSDPPGAVEVSDGLTPTITWAAECEAQVVSVYDAATGLEVWDLAANTRGIPKPVVYGVVPAGARVLHAAEPLQTGTGYGVFVAVLVGPDTVGSIGTFTP